jgi:hypothetical protein
MALWLSSHMVVVVSVMGELKTSPMSCRRWMESLLGGVSRRVVLGFTRGLSHTSLLFGLVTSWPASEGEEIAGARLAGAVVVGPVSVGKACELKAVVQAPPQRHAHVDGAMKVAEDFFQSMQVCLRG